MKQYVEISTCYDRQINDRIKDGWEIIDTVNSREQDTLVYHIGYPAALRIQELKEIIKKYEEFGFKEELFNKVAESNNDKVENYQKGGGGFSSQNPTVTFMSDYDRLVDDDEQRYYIKDSGHHKF